MNDKSLERLLRDLRVPAPAEGARDRALHRAQFALGQETTSAGEKRARHLMGFWAWAAGGALTVALTLVMVLSSNDELASQPEIDGQWKLLRQTEALFPGQLRAVIERGNEVHVELAGEPGQQSDQEIAVTFTRGDQRICVLSYSGRQVCLSLGGDTVCFEMLVTDDGDVILAGEDFVSIDGRPSSVAGYLVEARALRS